MFILTNIIIVCTSLSTSMEGKLHHENLCAVRLKLTWWCDVILPNLFRKKLCGRAVTMAHLAKLCVTRAIICT